MPRPIPRRRAAAPALTVALVAASLPLLAAPAAAAPPTTPFVSELHYDNDGADTGEFVEVQLPAGTSSQGLSVVLYNGSGGAVYGTRPLPTVVAPADAPAVVAVDAPGLQNGSPDGLALVGPDGVLEVLSYEGTFTTTNGPAAGRTTTDIGVQQSGSEPAGQSLSRTYDAATGALVWSGPATSTRGAVNPAAATPPPSTTTCDTPVTHEVGQVQGTGEVSPLVGETVTVRGTVVGDVPGLDGFYLQDADGDGDPATSDGVFVFSPLEVDLGDVVAARGSVSERFGQTQVAARDAAAVCEDGTAADLPAAAPLDLPADDAARERLEGMRVAPVDVLTVSEVFDLTSFGELTLSEGGRLVQPTELARPGTPEALAIAEGNALRSIVLDDGSDSRVSVATRPYLGPDTPVRVGDRLDLVAPLVLGYGFDAWRLQPADGTADGTFVGQNTRPADVEDVGGDVQVGAFNVLNYFLTRTGADARGARTDAAFEKQAAKIVAAIEEMDADVLALMEIEDTASTGFGAGDPDVAVADLVRRLNAAAGAEKWAYSPFPTELLSVDRDVIRNAIIYQPASVQPVGEPIGLVDEDNFDNAREPIAQTFAAGKDRFTVVANHFKSKGSGTGANADQGDGQGASNPDRVGQAQALSAFVDRLRSQVGDPDVLALGDFNAYSKEDPMEVLRAGGLVDLGERFDAGRYSYVFDALSGSLDHALATPSLLARVTDVAHWSINSVESSAYQYTGDAALYAPDEYRSSDHDPLVVGLDFRRPGQSGR